MAEPQKKPSAAKAQAPASEPAEQPQEQLVEPPVEESKPEPEEETPVPESTEVRFTREQLLNQSVLLLGTSAYVADAVLPKDDASQRWTEQEARGLVGKFLKQKVEVE